MRQSHKQSKRSSSAPWEGDASQAPPDQDALRASIMRKLNRLVAEQEGYWKDCPRRACRRQRTCAAPRIHCSNAPRLPPDPERTARAMAQLQRALKSLPARQDKD